MGETRIRAARSKKQLQIFEKKLLADLHALERMLDEGWFEIDATRIGAEQEFCIVDRFGKPMGLNTALMDLLDHPAFTVELARFNMEINAAPLHFQGDCLNAMEEEILGHLSDARRAAGAHGAGVVLTGILPTVRRSDFTMENLTPFERYDALCKAINKLRGKSYELHIHGIDELISRHDSPLLEAANTGFQVHLQIAPDEFVDRYNIAQAITAPVLSAATNSPILFGKRLWKETRVALFQQSVDTRSLKDHVRESSPRVTFGDRWMQRSILDIYRQDIVRYRVLLSTEAEENVTEKLASGEVPDLLALKIHNSTVYRWNRPCYGISEGKAHLRIENRVLPSGPTVADEMANAALWLGLMEGMYHAYGDVTRSMDFDAAKENFTKAGIHGLETKLKWMGGSRHTATDLLQKELIPLAEDGLRRRGIDPDDIDRYLGIVHERVERAATGSAWLLHSFASLNQRVGREEVLSTLVASTMRHQEANEPVHTWPLAELTDNVHWTPGEVLVEEFMTKRIFTVQPDDIIPLVSEIMEWERIRYVAVENDKGTLIGLVTSRTLLKAYSRHLHRDEKLPGVVKDIMIADPLSIGPSARVTEAMRIMQTHQFGCLPVVDEKNHLVGMVTEQNFLDLSESLFHRLG